MPTLEEIHRRRYARIWLVWCALTVSVALLVAVEWSQTWVSPVLAWLGCVLSVRIGARAQLIQFERPRGAYLEKVGK